MTVKIATLVFGGGISTLGMSVIHKTVESELGKKVEITACREKDVFIIKNSDILMVSLYWFDNIMYYLQFLQRAGIDPTKRKPLLIIGGSSALNTRILHGYFNYAVLGDGEMVVGDLIRAYINGSDITDLPGVIADGDFDSPKQLMTNPVIPANAYVEMRDNRTARIEIARGCRFKCAFCQLAHIKPYREQPLEIVAHLLKTTPTKSVGLFAPDRTGYSGYDKLEGLCRRLGKNNTAEDARLDMLIKKRVASRVKFGIEGFSEKSRRRFRKLGKPEQIVRGFRHIFDTLRTPKGKHITSATVYMIADLPGEGADAVEEFWDLMQEVDRYAPERFTLFMTYNSFCPMPFTPMERDGIHPYDTFERHWNEHPRLPNITVAKRGGLLGPSNRITNLLTKRGDERLSRVLFYLANDGAKIVRSNTRKAGEAVERLIKMCNVDPESIYGPLGDADVMPHHQFHIQPLDRKVIDPPDKRE
jgi:radical SAM superfamily enzyme YgiQ (UPF0313 family)